MKTTIVIINWNGEKYLPKLVSALDKEDCAILVVDNNSTDSTRTPESIDVTEGKGSWLPLNANWGFAQGNNFGGAVVNTENVLFMNNDMLPKPGFLKALEEKCTDQYPLVGAKLIFGETKEITDAGITLQTTEGKVQHAGIGVYDFGLPYEMGRGASPDDPSVNIGKEVVGVTGACMMVKTRVFCELRGFDTHFINGFEDVDFCWRAREKGYKSWYEPTAEVIHYCSSSKGRFDFEKENRDLLQKLWPTERVNNLKIK